MSAALLDIKAALELAARAALAPLVGEANIAWPNLVFQPPGDGTPYARVDHLWARTAPVGIGVDAFTRRPGILQVLLLYPLGKGEAASLAAAQAVCDAFKRGTRLNRGAVSVLVTAASPNPGFRDEGRWAQPVSVSWLVHSTD